MARERDIGDRLVDYWTGLDRGWQALWAGLAVVAAHGLVEVAIAAL